MTLTTRATGLVAGAGLALLLLTGCAGPSNQGDQEGAAPSSEPTESSESSSLATECESLQSDLQASLSELQGAVGDIASDPQSGVDALTKLSDDISGLADQATDPALKDALAKAGDGVDPVVEQLSAAIDDPKSLDQEQYTQAATEMQENFVAIDEVCSGAE